MSFIEYIPFSDLGRDEDIPSLICLGCFDGVHLGHMTLICETITMKNDMSKDGKKARAVAFCFSTIPANYFLGNKIKSIMTVKQKLNAFKTAGLDGAYVCDFGSVYRLSPTEFVQKILYNVCNCIGAVCGFNFTFGCRASGDHETLATLLSERNYPVNVIHPIINGGQPVSSSLIREHIENGHCEDAAELLGKPFSIEHTIVHGKNLGVKLGFPTINHIVNEIDEQIIPMRGVYATKVIIGGKQYYGVTNVGKRPTVSDSNVITCETHLIDVDKSSDFYGNNAVISFVSMLRREKKFDSFDELSNAIAKDVANAKTYFSIHP